ncbi:MAG TPA: ribulose-phosphate 3-epimerase [Candidatus Paceibacterota bacterium]|nr:ribulose-phosphate 3-epimerase [Candidatus Paceibacterota bacterium]
MIDVIPAVLPRTAKEFREAAERFASAGVHRAHLDICDGNFVPMKTIGGYKELRGLGGPLMWDVHLMVRRPEKSLGHWTGIPAADRLLFHVESTDRFADIAAAVRSTGRRAGAAVNPETPLSALEDVRGYADIVQFMTVIPGAQGRQFLPWVLENIAKFRRDYPDVPVAVDGGVTPDTAGGCVHAGASILVSGSFVLKSPDIARAMQEIQDSVE